MKSKALSIIALAAVVLAVGACSSPAPEPTATTGSAKAPTVASKPAGAATSQPTGKPATATTPAAAASATSGSATAGTTPSASPQPSATRSATSQPKPAGTTSPAKPTEVSVPPPGNVAKMDSPEAGVQVFLWGSPNVGRDLKLAKDAGFTWVKQMFQWDYIERDAKGDFLWGEPDRLVRAANQSGLKIVARIDFTPTWAQAPGSTGHNGPPANYEDFGDFISALVDRYGPGSQVGQIDAYEIWNEPNLAREWGGKAPNAAEYVDLLKTAYEAAKKANPKAMIVTAGLSPTGTVSPEARPDDMFLKEMYQAGAKDYFDVLGVHAAGFKAPPETSPDELASNKEYGGQRFFGFRRVEDLRKIMVENGDEDKQVMVLEMGWTTDNRPGSPYAWHAVTEQQKGEYIVRAYQYAEMNWSPWIGLMSTIYVSAPHWTSQDEQYYWALTNPDGTTRASYDYIKGRLP